MKVVCIIPARYASTRFPGKVLVEIDGKSMLQRVYERAKDRLAEVYVASDEKLICSAFSFPPPVILTDKHHFCGTNRCNEAVEKIERPDYYFDIVINLQADMPYIIPNQLIHLLSAFGDPNVNIATLVIHRRTKEPNDPNDVKVVLNKDNDAMYFSRQPISYCKHIGVYAYRRHVLKSIASLPKILFEDLEQNAWLYYGWKIRCVETHFDVVSINVPEDLLKLKKE